MMAATKPFMPDQVKPCRPLRLDRFCERADEMSDTAPIIASRANAICPFESNWPYVPTRLGAQPIDRRSPQCLTEAWFGATRREGGDRPNAMAYR